MGKVAYTVLVAFIASMLTLLAVYWLPPDDRPLPPPVAVNGQATATPVPDGQPAPTPGQPAPTPRPGEITLAQLAQHNSAASCWMAIDGAVYDVTTYIPRHPTPPEVVLEWCGKEATQAWDDKGGIGVPHSARAEALLENYRIGTLAR